MEYVYQLHHKNILKLPHTSKPNDPLFPSFKHTLTNPSQKYWRVLEQEISSFDAFFSKHLKQEIALNQIQEESTLDNSESKAPFSLKLFLSNCKSDLAQILSQNDLEEKKAKVALYNQQQRNMEALNLDFMQEMELDKIYTKSAQINSLFDMVAQQRPRALEEDQTGISTKKDDHLDFVRVPPLNKLIAPKPIFLDIAYDFLGNFFEIFLDYRGRYQSTLWKKRDV